MSLETTKRLNRKRKKSPDRVFMNSVESEAKEGTVKRNRQVIVEKEAGNAF